MKQNWNSHLKKKEISQKQANIKFHVFFCFVVALFVFAVFFSIIVLLLYYHCSSSSSSFFSLIVPLHYRRCSSSSSSLFFSMIVAVVLFLHYHYFSLLSPLFFSFTIVLHLLHRQRSSTSLLLFFSFIAVVLRLHCSFPSKRLQRTMRDSSHYGSWEPPGRFLDYCKFLFSLVQSSCAGIKNQSLKKYFIWHFLKKLQN